MSIVQSPEQREESRRVLLPWLARLRRWRQHAVARGLRRKKHKLSKDSLASLKAYGKQQVRILKERKRAEKIERKAEKIRLRLVKPLDVTADEIDKAIDKATKDECSNP